MTASAEAIESSRPSRHDDHACFPDNPFVERWLLALTRKTRNL
jgi:hypothetical protein